MYMSGNVKVRNMRNEYLYSFMWDFITIFVILLIGELLLPMTGPIGGRTMLVLYAIDLGVTMYLMYLMESPEDEGRDYLGASAVRVLRYLALLASLLLPAIYIALATFHQALIPLPLLRSIVESKQAVPFSTAAEVPPSKILQPGVMSFQVTSGVMSFARWLIRSAPPP